MWVRDISDIAVDRARQAARDRTTLHWVPGRHIKNWYLQRAVLAGYDRVYSATGGRERGGRSRRGGGEHGLPWSAVRCWGSARYIV